MKAFNAIFIKTSKMKLFKTLVYIPAFLNYIVTVILLIGLLLGFGVSLPDNPILINALLIIPWLGLVYFVLELISTSFVLSEVKKRAWFMVVSVAFNAYVFYQVVYN